MKLIGRLTGDNRTIELLTVITLLIVAISGILINWVFIAVAIADHKDLIYAIDNNNELLLYLGYLSLSLSTLINPVHPTSKLRSMVLGIASLTISFLATSIIHGFALKNIYLLVFILLVIGIAIKNNSLIPKNTIRLILYSLYLISFILVAIDVQLTTIG